MDSVANQSALQVAAWLDHIQSLSDLELSHYFSLSPVLPFPQFSDPSSLQPFLSRLVRLILESYAQADTESVRSWLLVFTQLQRSVDSVLESSAQIADLLLLSEDWTLIRLVLNMLKLTFSKRVSGQPYLPSSRLHALAMGLNLCNSQVVSYAEMHAIDSNVDNIGFSYTLADGSVFVSSIDSDFTPSNPEMQYALLSRRRFSKSRGREEAMVVQLMSVSLLMRKGEITQICSLLESKPETWLVPSLILMLRDRQYSPEFHTQIIEVLTDLLVHVSFVKEKQDPIIRRIKTSLLAEDSLQMILRDALFNVELVLPSATGSYPRFLKSVLALVHTICQSFLEKDKPIANNLTTILVEMLTQPRDYPPKRLAQCCHILMLILPIAKEQFKAANGWQLTTKLLSSALQNLSVGKERTKGEIDVVESGMELMKGVYDKREERTEEVNSAVLVLVQSPVFDYLLQRYEEKDFSLFNCAINWLNTLTDSLPTLLNALQKKGLLLDLMRPIELYQPHSIRVSRDLSNLMLKLASSPEGISVLEDFNGLDPILQTLSQLTLGETRQRLAQDTAELVQKMCIKMPGYRTKATTFCVRSFQYLKAEAVDLPKSEVFERVMGLGFLVSCLLQVNGNMSEVFLQSEGLDDLIALMTGMSVSLEFDFEDNYLATCFRALNSAQASNVLAKMIASLPSLFVRLELVLGCPLSTAHTLTSAQTPQATSDQVLSTFFSLSLFLETSAALIRPRTLFPSSSFASVVTSLCDLLRIVTHEEVLLEGNMGVVNTWLSGTGQFGQRRVMSKCTGSLMHILRYATSIVTETSSDEELALVPKVAEAICAFTNDISVLEQHIAIVQKGLHHLVSLLFHRRVSALVIVFFHVLGGTKKVLDCVRKIKENCVYGDMGRKDGRTEELLEKIWLTSGQFFECMVTWDYKIRPSHFSPLQSYGLTSTQQVSATFRTIIFDALLSLDLTVCSGLSPGFAKHALEVIKFTLESTDEADQIQPSLFNQLLAMGFPEKSVLEAIEVSGTSFDYAVNWLLKRKEPCVVTVPDPSQDTRIPLIGSILSDILTARPGLCGNVCEIIPVLILKSRPAAVSVISKVIDLCRTQFQKSSEGRFSSERGDGNSLDFVLQLEALSRHSEAVVDILIQVDFCEVLSDAIRSISTVSGVAETLGKTLEPILNLINTILKSSGQQNPVLTLALADMLDSPFPSFPPIFNSTETVQALLDTLLTLTTDTESAGLFLSRNGLYNVLCLNCGKSDGRNPALTASVQRLSSQLLEDPYFLQIGFSVDLLTAAEHRIPLKTLLKRLSKCVKRSKSLFVKTLQTVCSVYQSASGGLSVESNPSIPQIHTQKWDGIGQILRAVPVLIEKERRGKGEMAFSIDCLLSLLADAIETYPCLLDQLTEKTVFVHGGSEGNLISYLVEEVVPRRYEVKCQEGRVVYMSPGSNTEISKSVYEKWTGVVGRLMRGLAWEQVSKGKESSRAAALYDSFILQGNEPVRRSRNVLLKEIISVFGTAISADAGLESTHNETVHSCTGLLTHLLQVVSNSTYRPSAPVQLASFLTSQTYDMVPILSAAASWVKLESDIGGVLLNDLLAVLDVLLRYRLAFLLRTPDTISDPLLIHTEGNARDDWLPGRIPEEHSFEFHWMEDDSFDTNLEGAVGDGQEWELLNRRPWTTIGRQRSEVFSRNYMTGFRRGFLEDEEIGTELDMRRMQEPEPTFLMDVDEDFPGERFEYRRGINFTRLRSFLYETESIEELLQANRQQRNRDKRGDILMPSRPSMEALFQEVESECSLFARPESLPFFSSVNPTRSSHSDAIDPLFLQALPSHLQREITRSQWLRREPTNDDAVLTDPHPRLSTNLDNASLISMLVPGLRRSVLLTASEEFLNTLPEEVVWEARQLRDRGNIQVEEVRRLAGRRMVDERKEVREIVVRTDLCEHLIQPSDFFFRTLFQALYLSNPINRDVLTSLFLTLSLHPGCSMTIMRNLFSMLLSTTEPQGDFPPKHFIGTTGSVFGGYQLVYHTVSTRVLDIMKVIIQENSQITPYLTSPDSMYESPFPEHNTEFEALISLAGVSQFRTSPNCMHQLLSIVSAILDKLSFPPVLDHYSCERICSVLSADSLGDREVDTFCDVLRKLTSDEGNKALVEQIIEADLDQAKQRVVAVEGIELVPALEETYIHLQRLCRVLKVVNPEAEFLAMTEVWTWLGHVLQEMEEKEVLDDGLTSALASLIYIVEAYFLVQNESEVSLFGSEKARKVLNLMIKRTPAVLETSLALIPLRFPSMLDFENKQIYFKSQCKKRQQKGEIIRLKVHRKSVFMDTFRQLKSRGKDGLQGKLQVDFVGEEGLDLGGPTREWFSLLSKEMFNPNYALFTLAGNGVSFQPNPRSYINPDHLEAFSFIGKIVGKALVDGCQLDVHFTRSFYKHILGAEVSIQDIKDLDPEIYDGLMRLLDIDLAASADLFEGCFTYQEEHFGTIVTKELVPGGRNIPVTEDTKAEYVQLLCSMKMTENIKPQIAAFVAGFQELVPKEVVRIFDAKELEMLIAGVREVDIEDMKRYTEYHGYGVDSQVVIWFWELMTEFSTQQRAQLLQFVTGSSHVPLEGFKALRGSSGVQKFQIHRSFSPPDRLPTAHTW